MGLNIDRRITTPAQNIDLPQFCSSEEFLNDPLHSKAAHTQVTQFTDVCGFHMLYLVQWACMLIEY